MPVLGAAAWLHFGRLLPLADADELAGAGQPPRIVRAVNLAAIPNAAGVRKKKKSNSK
jgi:hypothetical protein